jgi:hypothetical protein
MRVRILLNAMGEARSWVLRAPKRSWRPICRAPSVRKKLSFKARERSVNVSHSWGGVRSDRAGILMEDFTFKVNLVAVVRVRAGDESVARKTVPTVLGAPGIAEIRLANENNAATGRHATVPMSISLSDRSFQQEIDGPAPHAEWAPPSCYSSLHKSPAPAWSVNASASRT